MEAERIARKAARTGASHDTREEQYVSPPTDLSDIRRVVEAARARGRKPGLRTEKGTPT